MICADTNGEGARATAQAILEAGSAAEAASVDIVDGAAVESLVDDVV